MFSAVTTTTFSFCPALRRRRLLLGRPRAERRRLPHVGGVAVIVAPPRPLCLPLIGAVPLRAPPVEVLRAATIDGARIIGVDQDLGSIEIGKLADMVVLNTNPLDNIRNTVDIDRVLMNGRLYNGDTMDQQWPDSVPLPNFWWWDQADRRFVPAVNRDN